MNTYIFSFNSAATAFKFMCKHSRYNWKAFHEAHTGYILSITCIEDSCADYQLKELYNETRVRPNAVGCIYKDIL